MNTCERQPATGSVLAINPPVQNSSKEKGNQYPSLILIHRAATKAFSTAISLLQPSIPIYQPFGIQVSNPNTYFHSDGENQDKIKFARTVFASPTDRT